MVFLSPVAYKAVYKYRWRWRPKAASDYFFVTDDGRRLGLSYIEHRMRDYGRKAGITGVRCSPHTLRHSSAVNYLRAGGDTFTLQRILGHSSLTMTRHYAELSDADIEAKQKTFSPAEKLGLRVQKRRWRSGQCNHGQEANSRGKTGHGYATMCRSVASPRGALACARGHSYRRCLNQSRGARRQERDRRMGLCL